MENRETFEDEGKVSEFWAANDLLLDSTTYGFGILWKLCVIGTLKMSNIWWNFGVKDDC